MNLNKSHFVFILLMMITFTSCDDEPLEGFDNGQNEEQDEEPIVDGIFQATLSDTIDFNATEITAELTEDGLQFSGKMNNRRIGFGLPNLEVGEKDLSTNEASGFYDTNVEEPTSAFFTAEMGVLNIQSLDTVNTLVSGTFSGEFVELSSNETVSVTDGSFTDIFFVDNTPDEGGPNDGGSEISGSLTVDIDGETNTFDLTENSFPDDQDVDVYTFLQANEDDPLGPKTVTLNLPSDVNQGSFDVNNYADQGNVLNPHSFRYDNVSESLIVFSVENTGQINISNVSDTIIEGTFNFDGQDLTGDQNLSFTNGSFTIELE